MQLPSSELTGLLEPYLHVAVGSMDVQSDSPASAGTEFGWNLDSFDGDDDADAGTHTQAAATVSTDAGQAAATALSGGHESMPNTFYVQNYGAPTVGAHAQPLMGYLGDPALFTRMSDIQAVPQPQPQQIASTQDIQHAITQQTGSLDEASCTWPGCSQHFTKRKNCDDHVESVHGTFDKDGMLVKPLYTCVCIAVTEDDDEDDGNSVASQCGVQYDVYRRNVVRHILLKHLKPQGFDPKSFTKGKLQRMLKSMYTVEYVPVREPHELRCRILCNRCHASFHDVATAQRHLKAKHRGASISALSEAPIKAPPPIDDQDSTGMSTQEWR